MAYIVDLTILMRIFFEMTSGNSTDLTKEKVYEVLKIFDGSSTKTDVHREIRSYVKDVGVSGAAKKGHVLDKVESLIKDHCTAEKITKFLEDEGLVVI